MKNFLFEITSGSNCGYCLIIEAYEECEAVERFEQLFPYTDWLFGGELTDFEAEMIGADTY